MEEKIKTLFIRSKKLKKREVSAGIENYIEKEDPDVYEYFFGYVWENVLEQVEKLRPKIIFLSQDDTQGTLELLKQLKQLYPAVIVFVFLSNSLDDEQETIDKYLAAGAYKCFFPALAINTLVHDMYVSLNLE